MTALGVSTPRPEVVEAAMAGMNQYFEMKDLVNKTGEYIAKLLDVEGATVVSCASAGIAQSVAAVLVKDSDWLLETCTLPRLKITKSCCRRATTSTSARRLAPWWRWAAVSWWKRLRQRMFCPTAGGGDHSAHRGDSVHQIPPLCAKKHA